MQFIINIENNYQKITTPFTTYTKQTVKAYKLKDAPVKTKNSSYTPQQTA